MTKNILTKIHNFFVNKEAITNYLKAWYFAVRNYLFFISLDALFRILSKNSYPNEIVKDGISYLSICIPKSGIPEIAGLFFVLIFVILIPVFYLVKSWKLLSFKNRKQKYIAIVLYLMTFVLLANMLLFAQFFYVLNSGIDSI